MRRGDGDGREGGAAAQVGVGRPSRELDLPVVVPHHGYRGGLKSSPRAHAG